MAVILDIIRGQVSDCGILVDKSNHKVPYSEENVVPEWFFIRWIDENQVQYVCKLETDVIQNISYKSFAEV